MWILLFNFSLLSWKNEQVITEIRGIRMFGDYHDQKRYAGWIHHLFGNCVTMYCNMLYNLQYRCHGISMRTLQLLDVKDIGLLEPLFGRVKFSNLVWLRWENYPYTSFPSWISMKNLRVQQVVGRNLETLWQRKSQVNWNFSRQKLCLLAIDIAPQGLGRFLWVLLMRIRIRSIFIFVTVGNVNILLQAPLHL